jgi:hypothetical protein
MSLQKFSALAYFADLSDGVNLLGENLVIKRTRPPKETLKMN